MGLHHVGMVLVVMHVRIVFVRRQVTVRMMLGRARARGPSHRPSFMVNWGNSLMSSLLRAVILPGRRFLLHRARRSKSSSSSNTCVWKIGRGHLLVGSWMVRSSSWFSWIPRSSNLVTISNHGRVRH